MGPQEDYRSMVTMLAGIGSDELSGPGGSPLYRGSATAGERLAADALTERLQAGGWRVERQVFAGYSSFAVRYIIHVAVIAAATALLPFAPATALGVTLIAALSLLIEHSTRGRVFSRLLPTGPSENLEAHLPVNGARLTIVLCAHYDTQRTGWCMSDPVQRLSRLATFLPVTLRVLFLPETLAISAQLVLAALAIGRPLPVFGWAVLALAALIHVGFLVVLANWAVGRFVPGASDNATGVAAVLSLAERWRAEPVAGVDLTVLLTGCEETGMLGAAEWASRNQHLRERCAFLNLDGLGFGPPHYLIKEVPVMGVPRRFDRRMLAIAAAVAEKFKQPVRPIALPGPTDGLAFLSAGFRGLTVVGCQPDGHLPFWHQPRDTPDRVDFTHACEAVEFAWLLLQAISTQWMAGEKITA